MILSGALISDHQACPRRIPLGEEFRVLRWRPKALFDACLRRAIVALSNGGDPAILASDAVSTFTQAAANPGLEVYGANPYDLSKDWTAMLEVLIRFLSKYTLLSLKEVPDVALPGNIWKVSAHQDDSGVLHRWITASRWDEDDLARELHGWHSFGDIAVTGLPMRLHVIQIGQSRNGRQVGPWARGYKHPSMPWLRIKFRKTDGTAFNGWKPVQLASLPPDYDTWAEQMFQEGMGALTHHLDIKTPSDPAIPNALEDISTLAHYMNINRSTDYQKLPMARSACDGIVPCPWQGACYKSPNVSVESLGLYQRRKDRQC